MTRGWLPGWPRLKEANARNLGVNVTEDTRWIQLYSGKAYWPLSPHLCELDIEDIAHALALNNRFNGHTREPYSVAQHSVHVSEICEKLDVASAIYGLMHDASEAVLHDIVRPIKHDFRIGEEAYIEVEARIQDRLLAQFGLNDPIPGVVWQADNVMLVTEQRDLMSQCEREWAKVYADPLPYKITPWPWQKAKAVFLDRFHQLKRGQTCQSKDLQIARG